MQIFDGYVDESGNDGISKFLILGGYVLPAKAWVEFSADWKGILDTEPRIPYFHASEANAGQGVFAGVRQEFRMMKVRNLVAVLEKHRPVGLVAWIASEDWKRILSSRVRAGFDDPYFPLFDWIVKELFAYQLTSRIPKFSVDYVFDDRTEPNMKANLMRIHEGVRKEVAMNPELYRMFGPCPTFKDDKIVLPLQAADLLLWHKRRRLNYPDEPREMCERLDLTTHFCKHLDEGYLLNFS